MFPIFQRDYSAGKVKIPASALLRIQGSHLLWKITLHEYNTQYNGKCHRNRHPMLPWSIHLEDRS